MNALLLMLAGAVGASVGFGEYGAACVLFAVWCVLLGLGLMVGMKP